MNNQIKIKTYFNEYVDIDEQILEDYGALNVSLVNDLPLFIDPFLLFESKNPEYQVLHDKIINHIKFLCQKNSGAPLSKGKEEQLMFFPEIKQTWLGFSVVGNGGSGLGKHFATQMKTSLKIFANPGQKVYKSEHIEKLCIMAPGVGRDFISDFTTNLIHEYLLEYTEKFAIQNIDKKHLKTVSVKRVCFDYTLERWMSKTFTLPWLFQDHVILTPKDILTKDEAWINSNDLVTKYSEIAASINNDSLRCAINDYFQSKLPAPQINPKTKKQKPPSRSDFAEAVYETISKHPEFVDFYLKYKEDDGENAVSISDENVKEVQETFIENVKGLIRKLADVDFYKPESDSHLEAKKRVNFLKQVIENNDGYQLFYHSDGKPIKREKDLQIIYRLTWYATIFDVNSETNNGRGPVDYKVSYGNRDKTLVEFKLASNSKMKQNLENQLEVYKKANETEKGLKVILFFSAEEHAKTITILKDLELDKDENVILIDARRDNKVSASNVKSIPKSANIRSMKDG